MNKFNKVLSLIFVMNVLVSSSSISAMEDCNSDVEYFKDYFEKKEKYELLKGINFNDENIKRYIFEIEEVKCAILRYLIDNYFANQSSLRWVRADFEHVVLSRKTKIEIKNDLAKCSDLEQIIRILSTFDKELSFIYTKINVLMDESGRKLNFVFDGKNGKLVDNVSKQDLQGKSNLIIEYECLDDVRKYKIHMFGYTINLEALKIDFSTGNKKKLVFEYMYHAYQNMTNEKAKNFMKLFESGKPLFGSDEPVFSKFEKNPQEYMIEKDEFELTVEKDVEKGKSEEILNFSFYL